jgi:hypothetical protein
MPSQTAVPAENRRLRFVFDDAVVSLSLAADATLGDVAQQWAELLQRHRGQPIAIDVTLPLPGAFASRFGARSALICHTGHKRAG